MDRAARGNTMGGTSGAARIGCCISGHGFGHATRAIAVMQALVARIEARFEILTSVPAWLFGQSLASPHTLHPMITDVGLVQQHALAEDLPATLEALDRFYPLDEQRIDQAAAALQGCQLVLCDIAPLGIAAAKRAGIPSILVENFTWDWIYAAYAEQWPDFAPHVEGLSALFAQADHHLQASPVCCPMRCDRQVDPVARRPRDPVAIRRRLECGSEQRLILITMGGVGGGKQEIALHSLRERRDLVAVFSGQSREEKFSGNLRFLAQDGPWYHPDLVAAADLVVGKVGYSTVAEAYQAGTAFAYVARRGFRESATLEAFLDSHLLSWKIEEHDLQSGLWLDTLPSWSNSRRAVEDRANGADQVADYLIELLGQTHARP